MIDWIYRFLANLGYTHPIHPAFVHIPIGNVVAAFVFGVVGLLFKRQTIGQAGYYALVLAFVSLFPAIFAGVTDWQHYFAGAWLDPIEIKVMLTFVLAVILFIAILKGCRDAGATPRGVILSFLCPLTVTGLGYLGADLVYSGISAPTQELEKGRQLFATNCGSCHPQGGNIIRFEFPLLGSAQLSNSKAFADYVRKPVLLNGEKGPMPGFPSSKISDRQMEALYAYIVMVLEKKSTP